MDLRVDSNGDLDITGGELSLTSGGEAVEQRTRLRLQFFLGSWFLDRNIGIPYYESILVKNPNLPAISAIFRQAIELDPEITAARNLELSLDAALRRLSVTFTAETTLLTPVVFDEEFILQ